MAATIMLKTHALGVRLVFTRRSKPQANAFLDQEVVAKSKNGSFLGTRSQPCERLSEHVGYILDLNQKEV